MDSSITICAGKEVCVCIRKNTIYIDRSLLSFSRVSVLPENRPWSAKSGFEYQPVAFTATPPPGIKADPIDVNDATNKQRLAALRRGRNTTESFDVDTRGYPLNPSGRTGIAGRGLLWSWGFGYCFAQNIIAFELFY